MANHEGRSPANQSKLEVNTCSWHVAREKVWKRVRASASECERVQASASECERVWASASECERGQQIGPSFSEPIA